MKRTVLFRISLLSLLLSLLAINVQAQGFKVHTKNGTATYYPHAEVDSIVFVTAINVEVPETPTSGTAIDLGLSVKWAACNVGATAPEEYGGYYAWGELEEKSDYSESSYLYYNSQTGYINIGDNISGTKYDVARAKWGGSWRMPTLTEFDELDSKCQWEWVTYKDVNGYKVTGPNGNSIFFPASGFHLGEVVNYRGSSGGCWSGALNTSDSDYAYNLGFYSGYRGASGNYNRYYGRSVRPVSD